MASTSWESRVDEIGLELPDPLPSGGLYSSVVIDGLVAYTSGIVAVEGPPLRLAHAGCLGADLDVDAGRRSARGALVSTLGNVRGALGSLDRIERFLRLTGYIRATPEFTDPPKVMDGASELLVEIFGEELLPSRTAVGVAALPGGASVEIDTIIKLRS